MRGIISRYIFTNLLTVFLVTLVGLTLLIVLAGVAQEAMRQGLGLGPILRLLPYILPDSLRFAVPATILFAACSVYGQMSSANEVVAIKSAGISPTAILWPVLVLGFLLSLAAVWLNDVAVSWGRRGIQRVVVQSVEQIAYGMLRTKRTYRTSRFLINVKRVEGRRLIQPTVIFFATDEMPAITITAREAEMRSNPAQQSLSVLLTQGTIDVADVEVHFPDTLERVIPLEDFSRLGSASTGPSDCALWQIPGEIVRQRDRILQLEQSMAARAAFQMVAGDFAALADDGWSKRRRQLTVARSRLNRLRTEPWRRWANGFSCLFFVMVGAPLAIRLRNADFTTSFFLCFLPILVVYYPLLAFGVDRAKCGVLPPYTVWLGNGICLLVGMWLVRRVIRY